MCITITEGVAARSFFGQAPWRPVSWPSTLRCTRPLLGIRSVRPARIDARGLTFADGGAANLFLLATRAGSAGVHLTCRDQLARVLAVVGADEVTALMVTKVGALDHH
jgi:hypothetical protein